MKNNILITHLFIAVGLLTATASLSAQQPAESTAGHNAPATSTDAPVAQSASTTEPTDSAISTTSTLAGSVLRVNDSGLTSAEIIEPLREQLNEWADTLEQKTFLTKAHPLLAQACMSEIYSLLLYQHAKADLDRLDNAEAVIAAEMEKQRKKLIARHGGSEARTRTELAQQGTSVEKQLDALKRELIVSAYRDAHFDPSFEITRSELIHYYRTHLDEFAQKAFVEFQLIDIHIDEFLSDATITPTPEQRNAARDQAARNAREAWQQAQAGTDFTELVAQFSHGLLKAQDGLWSRDPAAFNVNYKPIISALYDAEINQCTGIIETEDRFFIAKVIARTRAQNTPFAQAQFEIAEKLRQQRWQRFSQKLSQELLEKATIGDLDQFILDTALTAYRQLH